MKFAQRETVDEEPRSSGGKEPHRRFDPFDRRGYWKMEVFLAFKEDVAESIYGKVS